MRKRRYTLVEVLVVFSILGILAVFGYGVYQRVTCKHGHEEFIGGFECWGTEIMKTCEPAKVFVCDDKDDE